MTEKYPMSKENLALCQLIDSSGRYRAVREPWAGSTV